MPSSRVPVTFVSRIMLIPLRISFNYFYLHTNFENDLRQNKNYILQNYLYEYRKVHCNDNTS